MTNFMVGSISYLPDDHPRTDARITFHQRQLTWLESIQENQGLDFPYYRIESAWGTKAKSALGQTKLNLISVTTEKHPPGYNRNLLLELLYASDKDWLVCLDDDRMLYPMYDGDAFFKDLGTPAVQALARQGYLITCTPPNFEPFKRDVCSWEYRETHWYLFRETPYGFLQICFIPNLVKFGMKPIFFNGETECLEGDPPEDVQFELDWLIHKHPIVRNKNLIMQEIGQTNADWSSIYQDLTHRRACETTHKAWLTRYLKEAMPRKPDLWTRVALNRRMNPTFTQLIPRSCRYEFDGRDFPRDWDDTVVHLKSR